MTVSALRADTSAALRRDLALVQARDRQPSLVAGVLRDGALVWCEGRGDVGGDPVDMQYRIGSLTKSFTALLVLQCRDEGLVDLDGPVADYLPRAPWPDTSLRRLLAHVGGLPAEPAGPWWERHDGGDLADLFGRLEAQALAVEPGSQFHYSNVGFALLGAVVERVRSQAWADVLGQRVLTPLRMTRTTYAPTAPHAQGWSVHPWSGRLAPEPHTDTAAMAPAGQLWSTIGDLARWAAFWLEPTPDVLDPQTAAEMRVPTAVQPGDSGAGYGLGLSVGRHDGRPLFGHGGSMPGFVAGIAVDPESRAGAFALANATVGGVGGLPTTLLERLHAYEPALPAPWTPEPELDGTDGLLGPWFWGNTPWGLAVRGGFLELETGNPARSSRFVPDGVDRWRGLDAYFTGEALRVVRSPDGAVDHVELATYELRREPYA